MYNRFIIVLIFLITFSFSQSDLPPIETFNSFVIKLKDYEDKYVQNQDGFKEEIQEDLRNELNSFMSKEPELIKNYLKIESYAYQWSMSKIYSLSGNFI